ncbi:hypothetical protein O6H91_16G078200 [Diphasiastrum complanatum]|uniref:Uncharacterized protein n=1 Tax=Diphasiastrum complanatum TaxID=34168 RepID=A0ACC2BE00_DIPCM|nr:hypothetical protein O6H91_16G078200 [Diphasiastrum complanatum]
MDEQTERHLAALILKEATRLREQADQEGVHVYLSKPTVRARPNPQFLQATVRSVQQANRMVEVNEMWRRRTVELKVNDKQKSHRHRSRSNHDDCEGSQLSRPSGHSRSRQIVDQVNYPPRRANLGSSQIRAKDCSDLNSVENSISNDTFKNLHSRISSQNHERYKYFDAVDHSEDADLDARSSADDDDLRDEELEEFLLARVKRGRGAVGSRMDETGPYPVPHLDELDQCAIPTRVEEDWETRIAGPSTVSEKDRFLGDKTWKLEKKRKNRKHKNKPSDPEQDSHKSKTRKKEKEDKEKRRRKDRDEERYQNLLKKKRQD